MTSHQKIFAACKQEGLKAFRKWKASLDQPNLLSVCDVIDSILLPGQKKIAFDPLIRRSTVPDFRKRRDEFVVWLEARQRDNHYPQLDRLTLRKKKIFVYNQTDKMHQVIEQSSTAVTKN